MDSSNTSSMPFSVMVSKGPSAEDWERWKDKIHQLYIVQGKSLAEVMSQMRENHGFEAREKMYYTRFAKWGPRFRKNKQAANNSEANRLVTFEGPRTRVKRTKPEEFQTKLYGHPRRILPIPPMPTQSTDRHMLQLSLLNSISDYTNALFQTFSFSSDNFDIIIPPGVTDNSMVWQQLSDECFGATTLMMKGFHSEGTGSFSLLCDKLRGVVGQKDIAMIIKLWRICIRLYKVGQELQDFTFLHGFTRYFHGLAAWSYGDNHPITHILGTITRIPVNDLPDTFRICYHRTVECLQERTSFTNAVVLQTWSNFLKSCDRHAVPINILISGFGSTLAAAEQMYTSTGEKTITILHAYLYAAYYNAQNYDLTQNLARDLIDRVKALPCLQERPTWCIATQAYALSVKLMLSLAKTAEEKYVSQGHMADAILKLGFGDRECQTRAVMLADILDDSEVKWKLLQRIQQRFGEEGGGSLCSSTS